MVEALFAATLGVAVAGIVLIYRGHRRNRDEINRLRAELTATKIAAIQQAAAPQPTEEPPPLQDEPVRRKRHLMLYLGGLAAFIAWLGERARNTWKNHRTATTAVVLAATAATAAAAGYTSAPTGNGAKAAPEASAAVAPPLPSQEAATPSPSETPGPEETSDPNLAPMDNLTDPVPESTDTAAPRSEESPRGRNLASTREPAGTAPATEPNTSPTRGTDPGGTNPGGSAPEDPPPAQQPADPQPAPEPQQPDPPVQPEPPQPTPTPSPSKTCTIHVGLPPLLDICL
ncbi:hypothetical protein ACH46L_03910 [Streptomyces althioticus]|uniref:hypothetical protein n=1 Tax=Streptomyces althioticus TaxID=83380 RepID=UPI0037885206